MNGYYDPTTASQSRMLAKRESAQGGVPGKGKGKAASAAAAPRAARVRPPPTTLDTSLEVPWPEHMKHLQEDDPMAPNIPGSTQVSLLRRFSPLVLALRVWPQPPARDLHPWRASKSSAGILARSETAVRLRWARFLTQASSPVSSEQASRPDKRLLVENAQVAQSAVADRYGEAGPSRAIGGRNLDVRSSAEVHLGFGASLELYIPRLLCACCDNRYVRRAKETPARDKNLKCPLMTLRPPPHRHRGCVQHGGGDDRR